MKAPAGIGRAGRRFWTDITGSYDLGPHELVLLEDACRIRDLMARLWSVIGSPGFSLRVDGSMRQPTAAPELDQWRLLQAKYEATLRLLKLPDPAGVPEPEAPKAVSRSRSARAAAAARWGTRGSS